MNLIEIATHTQNTLDQLTVRIDSLAAEHTAILAAKEAEYRSALEAKDLELNTIKAAFEEKVAYQAAMEQRVAAVIQSGNPAEYEALARDFLTPAEAKARAEKLARIEALKAEAAALESELS